MPMDWSPVVTTFMGALVGVGATTIADRGRWRREKRRQASETRRELYSQYLLALHDAGEQLRAVALGDLLTDLPRTTAAREAFRSSNLPVALERMRITAPEGVGEAAGHAFHCMRRLRNRVAEGAAVGSLAHREAELACEEAHRNLGAVMRDDLDNR